MAQSAEKRLADIVMILHISSFGSPTEAFLNAAILYIHPAYSTLDFDGCQLKKYNLQLHSQDMSWDSKFRCSADVEILVATFWCNKFKTVQTLPLLFQAGSFLGLDHPTGAKLATIIRDVTSRSNEVDIENSHVVFLHLPL